MSSVQLSEQDLETAIAALTDAEHIKEARKAAESEAGKLTTEDWHTLRKLAKSNLYFLASTILGYNKLSPDLHGHFCAWLVKNDNEQFRETLLPRGHFKSTIQTISDSIRVALPDDAGDAGHGLGWHRGHRGVSPCGVGLVAGLAAALAGAAAVVPGPLAQRPGHLLAGLPGGEPGFCLWAERPAGQGAESPVRQRRAGGPAAPPDDAGRSGRQGKEPFRGLGQP